MLTARLAWALLPTTLSAWGLLLVFLAVLVTSVDDVVRHWSQHLGGARLRRFWNDYLLIAISLYIMGSVVLTGH